MEKDTNTYSHLLANPFHCRGNIVEKTIDDHIIELLQRKYPHLDIHEKDYYNNVHKIENMFIDCNIHNIVTIQLQSLIEEVINGAGVLP
jgi:hypothetical protein